MAEDQEFVLPPLEERPLVTFALFAYNQEKYIREAVEGAFAQTYEPLEIILSDDCSTDRTFEIIEELASNYNGPHKVLVTKNHKNLGLAGHINFVSTVAKGDILVMAAGDDISLPFRSTLIAKEFINREKIAALFTDVRKINIDGQVINEYADVINASQRISVSQILRNGGGVGIGASYAYKKQCFSWPSLLPTFVTNEDRLLPLRAALLGEVWYVPSKTLEYRISDKSLSALLSNQRAYPILNKRHLGELKTTIAAAKKSNIISKKESKLYSRILRELPAYFFLILSERSFFSKIKFLRRLIDNWFNRDSLITRLKNKM